MDPGEGGGAGPSVQFQSSAMNFFYPNFQFFFRNFQPRFTWHKNYHPNIVVLTVTQHFPSILFDI